MRPHRCVARLHRGRQYDSDRRRLAALLAAAFQREADRVRMWHAAVERLADGDLQLGGAIHSVVQRVIAQAGLPRIGGTPRPSRIDAYLPLIRQTLEKFPTLTASRLFAMAYERGYRGSPDHFRHLIALHRPRRPAEAYLRLCSLAAQEVLHPRVEESNVPSATCAARSSPRASSTIWTIWPESGRRPRRCEQWRRSVLYSATRA